MLFCAVLRGIEFSMDYLPCKCLSILYTSIFIAPVHGAIVFLHTFQIQTCEMLILEPLEPDTTIALKLLNSDKLFCALPPVLSRQSFSMRFTWFSKVCRRVLPGVGSSSSLWAFSMTSITSCCEIATKEILIHFYINYLRNLNLKQCFWFCI